MNRSDIIEVEECDNCTNVLFGYVFPHYHILREECLDECPTEEELDEMYPNGWLDINT
jgi:hypothetical protein